MILGGIVGGYYGQTTGQTIGQITELFYAEYTAANIVVPGSATNAVQSNNIPFNAETVRHGRTDRTITFNNKTGIWTAQERGVYDFVVSVHLTAAHGAVHRAEAHLEYRINNGSWQDFSSDAYQRTDGTRAITPYVHGEEPILLEANDFIAFRVRRIGQTALATTYDEIRATVVQRAMSTRG